LSRSGLGANYWKLWAASTASNLGDGVTMVAAPLLAATLTRDPFLVASLTLAHRLPWMLFTLVAGALVDRLDRRRVMWAVDAARAAVIGLLSAAVYLGWANLLLLYAVFFALGALETFFDNAAQAILPAVVGREQLEKANGRLFGAQVVTNEFAGPPLGGFLFAAAAAVPFLLNAGTFAAAAVLVLAMRGSYRPRKEVGAPATTLAAEIGEGLRWLWSRPLLRTLAIMLGVINAMYAAVQAILVLFALEVLGLGEVGFGALLTAGAAGGLLGSFVAEPVTVRIGHGRALLAAVLVSAAALAGIALTANPFVVGAMFLVSGVSAVVWNVITVSLRQSIIPERLFGRVNSAYRLLGWGGMSLGALLGGLLASILGLTAPMWFGAAALAAMFLIVLPRVNNRTVTQARSESPERG
jgi:MFS family permease